MKKIYFALMCMASLALMTACGNKTEKADAEKENTEEVANEDEQNADEQNAEEQNSEDQADVWGDPAKAAELNLTELYAAGDFKPATNVIFEDTLGGETVSELPTKWDIKHGSAEIAEAQGHKFITMMGGDTEILPLVGNNSKNFLPEKYTMEFEFMFGKDVFFYVNFFDAEENGIGDYDMCLYHANWNMAKADDEWMGGEKNDLNTMLNRDGWNHFAASYDKGNLKFFINGKRIANLPNIKQAAYFVIRGGGADGSSHYIKNIRVAK